MSHQRYIDVLCKAFSLLALVFVFGTGFVTAFAYEISPENESRAAKYERIRTDANTDREIPTKLFDIRLSIDDPVLETSKKLSARADFISFGRVPTAVTLTWSIVDEYGTEMYRTEGETLFVETELSYPYTFVEVPALDVGNYTLTLTTRYNGDVEDTFKQSFRIEEQKDDAYPFLILGFMTLVGAGWFAYLMRHRHGSLSRERMIAITSRAAVFLLAGAVLPAAGLLLAESADVSTQSSAVYMSSLDARAAASVEAFLAHIQNISLDYSKLSKTALSSKNEEVYTTARDMATVTSLYSVDEDSGVVMNAHRKLGFLWTQGSRTSLPQSEGLVQGSDGRFAMVMHFPRPEGGYYIAQTSLDPVIAKLIDTLYGNEEFIITDDTGLVLLSSTQYPQGSMLSILFPSMWNMLSTHEYYQDFSAQGQTYIGRRFYLQKGDDYEQYHLVIRGQYAGSASSKNRYRY